MSTTTIELHILHIGYGFNYVDGGSWTRILRNLSFLFFFSLWSGMLQTGGLIMKMVMYLEL